MNFRLQDDNSKYRTKLDQKQRKNIIDNENLKDLNARLEKKLLTCVNEKTLKSKELEKTSDRLR